MKQQTGGQLGSKDRQPTCVVWIWVEILWFNSISLTSRPTSNCTEQRRFIASYSQPTTSSVRLASKCSTGPGQPGHWAIECINNKFSYNKSLKFSLRMNSPFIYTWNAINSDTFGLRTFGSKHAIATSHPYTRICLSSAPTAVQTQCEFTIVNRAISELKMKNIQRAQRAQYVGGISSAYTAHV